MQEKEKKKKTKNKKSKTSGQLKKKSKKARITKAKIQEQIQEKEEFDSSEIVQIPEEAESDNTEKAYDTEVVSTLPVPSSKMALAPTEKNTELVHLDPLMLYINEIRRYPVLPPDEEKRLTILYYENRDEDAARRIILSNLRLVVKIAFEYRKAYKNVLDLVQEGNLGLMMALKKFDPYKGVRFISYAAWWIRAYILRYILNNWRMVRIGTTQVQRKLFINLHKEKEKLEQMGIKPDSALIAKTLNIDEAEVVEMDKRLSMTDLSLDSGTKRDDGSESFKIDTVQDESERADEILALAEFNEKLQQKLEEFSKKLDGKEKIIYEERLISDRPKTLQEIGDEFGITRERIRQIEARVMKKLKEYLMAEMGEYFDESWT